MPSFRTELVRNLLRTVLEEQADRDYAAEFQVVHHSIQRDHLHLIVEAVIPGADASALPAERTKHALCERDMLRRGISGLAISFARRLNSLLGRRGKVWADRHHRRDLESPTDVRNTILYVLQNWLRHGMKTFGAGLVDPFSSAIRFEGWADTAETRIDTEPWPNPRARTWLLRSGWARAGGLLRTSDTPLAARGLRHAPIVASYIPLEQEL